MLTLLAQDAFAVWHERPFDDAWVARNCPADVLVVMGAAQYDGRPSPALARRLDGASRLYQAGCAPLVVVTGGRREGDRTSEGAAGVAYLRAAGLPEGALMAEEGARSSLENLANVHGLVAARRYVLVTDDLHVHRTGLLAGHLGLEAAVAGVRVVSGRLEYAWRELRAVAAYRLGVLR